MKTTCRYCMAIKDGEQVRYRCTNKKGIPLLDSIIDNSELSRKEPICPYIDNFIDCLYFSPTQTK